MTADRKMFKRGDLISAYRDKTQELKKMQTKLSAIQHSLLVLKASVKRLRQTGLKCPIFL